MSISARTRLSTWSTDAPEAAQAKSVFRRARWSCSRSSCCRTGADRVERLDADRDADHVVNRFGESVPSVAVFGLAHGALGLRARSGASAGSRDRESDVSGANLCRAKDQCGLARAGQQAKPQRTSVLATPRIGFAEARIVSSQGIHEVVLLLFGRPICRVSWSWQIVCCLPSPKS